MDRYASTRDLVDEDEIDLTMEADIVPNNKLARGRKRKQDEDEDEETEKKRIMANTQERARMRKINKALEDLRKVLPQEFGLYHRRMSKIRTLRLAMNYIKNMSDLIIQDNLRRHNQCMTPNLQYAQMPFPDMTHISSVKHPEMDSKDPGEVSPMPFASMIPVYPYLGPLCMGFNPSHSPYHTPDQTNSRRSTNPRHLNFGPSPPEQERQHSCTDGIMETPAKRYRQECRPEYNHKGRTLKAPSMRIKTETITSPLLGQRNPTEHDSSFLSTASDGLADDTIEIRPLQTEGRIIPSGRTLADILKDDEAS